MAKDRRRHERPIQIAEDKPVAIAPTIAPVTVQPPVPAVVLPVAPEFLPGRAGELQKVIHNLKCMVATHGEGHPSVGRWKEIIATQEQKLAEELAKGQFKAEQ